MSETGEGSDHPAETNGQVPEQAEQSSEASTRDTVLGVVILVVLLGLGVWGFISLIPDDLPANRDPRFIDNIFDNGVVVAAARVVLLATAAVLLATGVYIVVSMIVRMSRQEWLRRAGPFEPDVAKQVDPALEEAEDFFEDYTEALDENEQLAARLTERDEMIQGLLDERAALIQELERRRET